MHAVALLIFKEWANIFKVNTVGGMSKDVKTRKIKHEHRYETLKGNTGEEWV